jgi:myosin heavy subunit
VQQALLAMDMSTEVQDHLFTILSGIMRLGNIQFEGAEVSKVSNPQGAYSPITDMLLRSLTLSG